MLQMEQLIKDACSLWVYMQGVIRTEYTKEQAARDIIANDLERIIQEYTDDIESHGGMAELVRRISAEIK